MSGLYECSKCGVVTKESEQVCTPQELVSKQRYCGRMYERDTQNDCIRDQVPFVCAHCGRPAKQAERVCIPVLLG